MDLIKNIINTIINIYEYMMYFYEEMFLLSKKTVIETSEAPVAIGPYSQAIKFNNLIFISGQLPIDKEGKIKKSVQEQTLQSIRNIEAILKRVGLNLSNVLKTTVFLNDINNFNEMNKVYEKLFVAPFPARSCIEVARLPKDAKIEIEVIAAL